MDRNTLIMIILFPVLIALQVLICNHIMLFNVAVPFIYIYFILRLPVGMSKNWLFTVSFLLGFLIDLFSDTPGVNSLASILLAGMKQPIFYAYVPRDDKTKNIIPSINSLGWQNYSKYLISMSGFFCLIYFCIEFFNFANPLEILLMTLASSVLTFGILYGVDSLISSGNTSKHFSV